jgi:hypothetical protein
MKAHADLLGCKEGSFIEFACPYHLDSFPSLLEVRSSDTKLNQVFLNKRVHWIIIEELKLENKILASVEHLIHLLDAFGL